MSSKDGRVRWGIISTANIGMEKVTPGIQRTNKVFRSSFYFK